MLPTPEVAKLPDSVYEPSEDSYLMLDTLSSASECAFLSSRFGKQGRSCPLVVEIGPGSGVVLSFITTNAKHIFGHSAVMTLGVDVNEFACRSTLQTVALNQKPRNTEALCLDVMNGNLVTTFIGHSIDMIVFNPPYVPSEEVPAHDQSVDIDSKLDSKGTFARNSRLIALATDGGIHGMEVTNNLLESLRTVLHASRGVAYILLCARNQPEKVKESIRAWGGGWQVETVRDGGKQGGWEKLQVIRIWIET